MSEHVRVCHVCVHTQDDEDYRTDSCEIQFEQHNIFYRAARHLGAYNKVCECVCVRMHYACVLAIVHAERLRLSTVLQGCYACSIALRACFAFFDISCLSRNHQTSLLCVYLCMCMFVCHRSTSALHVPETD